MADITPLTVFSSAGERNTTGLTLADGFPASQKPKRQWMNWLLNDITAKVNQLVAAVNALQDSTVHQLPVNSIVEIDEVLTAEQFATKIGYGTWVVHGAGRVIVGAGSVTIDYSAATGEAARDNVMQTFVAGQMGGEITHKQTTEELVEHRHSDGIYNKFTALSSDVLAAGEAIDGDNDGFVRLTTGSTDNLFGTVEIQIADITEAQAIQMTEKAVGNSQPFNVMQPYLVASRFKRTS